MAQAAVSIEPSGRYFAATNHALGSSGYFSSPGPLPSNQLLQIKGTNVGGNWIDFNNLVQLISEGWNGTFIVEGTWEVRLRNNHSVSCIVSLSAEATSFQDEGGGIWQPP